MATFIFSFLLLLLYLLFKSYCLLCFFSVSEKLPTGQLSNIPWRRTGVKYTNNEAYFDVVEEVDAIIDKSGATVFAEIQGYVGIFIANIFENLKYSFFRLIVVLN